MRLLPYTKSNIKKTYLASKTTRPTNAMDIKLSIVWKVVINHQRNLKREQWQQSKYKCQNYFVSLDALFDALHTKTTR